ncbi:MAG: AmmeMemoRadiSam system protein B, partial [Deltaproteobacteria bacterium]
FSGGIAGAVIGSVTITDTVLLLGPNHHGIGERAALFPGGTWHTPLGPCAIDEDLAQRFLENCPFLKPDTLAHKFEHSLEVQVPFLQAQNPNVRIVPICLGHLAPDQLLAIGRCIGATLAQEEKPPLMLASSDMSHYVSAEEARRKDMLAIQKILDLDPEGLYRVVRDERISMCGVLPAVVLLVAARELGATTAELVRYGHSGEVTGGDSEVVGYAGIRIR